MGQVNIDAVNVTVSHISPMVSYIPLSLWYEGTPADPALVGIMSIYGTAVSH